MKLIDVAKHLATDEQCFAYLERRRWPIGEVCDLGYDCIKNGARDSVIERMVVA